MPGEISEIWTVVPPLQPNHPESDRLLGILLFARRVAGLLAVVWLLAACASPERRSGAESERPTPDRFELSGRIAVKYRGDGYTGSLRWRHRDQRDTIELYSPVGTVYARLASSPEGASLRMADGKRFDEADARALARRVLGWDLPLAQMRYWVFARPAPATVATRVDTDQQGRLIALDQDGWQVRYLSFASVGGVLLPDKLELEEPGLKVKLIVSRWGAPPES